MFDFVFNFKRATIFVALFFSLSSFAVSQKTETYKDLIDKAYNLSLQKDRAQATNLLVNGIKKEEKKANVVKELSATLEKVANVFYSDKAQQNFELALSLRWSDPQLAQTKLTEASRLEPDNLMIELEILRIQISANDCDKTQSRLQNYSELVPYLEDLKLVQAQSYVCVGKFSDYQKLRSSIDLKKSNLAIFWQILDAEYYFRSSHLVKANEALNSIQKMDPLFPETQFWIWKTSNQKSEKSAQKYLASCKGLSTRAQRKYGYDPGLCRRTTEVESFLKKNNNPEI